MASRPLMSPWDYSQNQQANGFFWFLLIKKIFLAKAHGILVLQPGLNLGPSIGSTESQPLNHEGCFSSGFLKPAMASSLTSFPATLSCYSLHMLCTLPWQFCGAFSLLGSALPRSSPMVEQRAKGDGRRVWLEWRSHAEQNSMDNQSHWEFWGKIM